MIGLPLFACLPNNYPKLFEAYSECKLLSNQSVLGQELERLAERMIGVHRENPKRRRSGFSDWLANLGLISRGAVSGAQSRD